MIQIPQSLEAGIRNLGSPQPELLQMSGPVDLFQVGVGHLGLELDRNSEILLVEADHAFGPVVTIPTMKKVFVIRVIKAAGR